MHTVVLLVFLFALLTRHLPQVALDVRNIRRTKRVESKTRVPAVFLWVPWLTVHMTTAVSLLGDRNLATSSTVLGLIALIAGAALGIAAIVQLGRSYAHGLVVFQDSRLITSGPYSIMHHPLRVGLALEVAGSCLIAHSGIAWFALALLVWGLLLRTQDEERMLVAAYGAPAREYLASDSPGVETIVRALSQRREDVS